MKINKKRIIVLYIIAFFLIILATFGFIYKTPKIDNEIKDKEKEVNVILQNQLNYQDSFRTDAILVSQWKILKEINPNSTEFDDMYISITLNRKTLLTYAHLIYEGTPPTEEEQKSWDSFSLQQFNNELAKYMREGKPRNQGIYSLPKVQESINKLNDEKKWIFNISSFFQILGLFITNIATILGISWKKDLD